MNSDFWIKKWQDGEIRFHQSQFHPELVKYAGQFRPGPILVPLCGKSLDMHYLASRGHSVIGVELSPIACRNFFEEAHIPFIEKPAKGFILFESEAITLWCGDFFQLPQQVWDKVSGVYDRAALIALPEELRPKYAAEMARRGPKHLEILLITLEYPEGSVQGPPFSVSTPEVEELFHPFKIQKIHSKKEEKFSKDHPKLQSLELYETVYWIHQ